MEALNKVKLDKIFDDAFKYAKNNESTVMISAGLAAVFAGLVVLRRVEMNRDGADYDSTTGGVKLLNNAEHTLKSDQFGEVVDDYENMFDGARKSTGAITSDASIEVRKQKYASMVDHFYNIVTDFYEYGWGQSFHFAPRWKNETFMESIKRAEYFLAAKIGLGEGKKALDVGCGVGGPMRNIAIFSGGNVTGITINQYQVNIGNKYNQNAGLADRCKSVRGDFQNLPWSEGEFDCAYEIEATCHSPDRVKTFGGICRVLKPGGYFAGYEWVMTDNYNPKNADHVRIKEGIEVGNALPTLVHYSEIVKNLKDAGFEVVEYYDANRGVHSPDQIPWYDTLNGKFTLSGFRMTHLGRSCTHALVWFLETIRIAPLGSTKISALLNATAIDLVDGGKEAIFTPSFYFLARKPVC
jgi:sterol 24-C-methyltransferase